jgi:hypothetical protein
MEISPGWSVLCDTRGVEFMREDAPRMGCEDLLLKRVADERQHASPVHDAEPQEYRGGGNYLC